jgi:hypothetical protein
LELPKHIQMFREVFWSNAQGPRIGLHLGNAMVQENDAS